MTRSDDATGGSGGARIRRAAPGDAPALAELSTTLGYPSTTEAVAARLGPILAHDEHAVFVAEAPDGRPAGYIQVSVRRCVESDTVAEIVALIVDEDLRGTGLGGTLVAGAERWAADRGLVAVVVRSRVHRAQAHRFYERLDYRHIKDQRVFRKELAAGRGPVEGPARGPGGTAGRGADA